MSVWPAPLRRHGAAVAAFLLCLAHFATFRISSQPIVTDVRYFLYFAWRVSEGAVPHLTFFENKTQLATFAGALLYRLGDGFGLDPLLTIRTGYLGITVLGGMAVFFIFRRLWPDDAVAGLLGVAAYCSFGLLGLMPATGNIPKLLMAVCASLVALLVHERRWFWAGCAGALAFMDWQVGLLAWLAALGAATVHGVPRLRASLRVVAGGAAGLAPFVVYYAVNGALAETVRQVIGSSLFRGSSAMAGGGKGPRLSRIAEVVDLACPSQQWLFYSAVAGMGVVAWWIWRAGRRETGRTLLALAIYHFGVVAFSLVDFQYYGDLFVLLHSIAFFLGALWVAVYRAAVDAFPTGRVWIAAGAVTLALLLARPGVLRPDLELKTPIAAPGATLADQRAVARTLLARIGAGPAVLLENSELLFLMRKPNALPIVYWNHAAWPRYRNSAAESFAAAGLRMMLSVDADAFVPPRALGYDALLQRGYAVVRLASENGRYAVTVAVRPAEATACLRIPRTPVERRTSFDSS